MLKAASGRSFFPSYLVHNPAHLGSDGTRVVGLANRLANRHAATAGRHRRLDCLQIHSPDGERW
jgi:hypothetical protein